MKLLLDENLSYRIVRLISAKVEVVHCSAVTLLHASDRGMWEYAAANQLLLVTKDDDFRQLAVKEGFPPKIVWLNVGNARTTEIAQLLLNHLKHLEAFANDPDSSLLVLG